MARDNYLISRIVPSDVRMARPVMDGLNAAVTADSFDWLGSWRRVAARAGAQYCCAFRLKD
jgi:hypothetical protein